MSQRIFPIGVENATAIIHVNFDSLAKHFDTRARGLGPGPWAGGPVPGPDPGPGARAGAQGGEGGSKKIFSPVLAFLGSPGVVIPYFRSEI